MKVLLIDPPWFSLQGMSHAPLSLGLCYIGTYLEKFGHKCLIFSGETGFSKSIKLQKVIVDEPSLKENKVWKNVLEELFKVIDNFKPQLIGITMPTAKYLVVKELARIINKKYPKIHIVLGGMHPTILPKETINLEGISFIVEKEGEKAFLRLVKDLEKGKNIRPFYSEKYIKNLDDLPFPNFKLFYGWKKLNKDYFGNIIATRGCPFNCIFCSSRKMWGTNVRFRSPENIVEEIKQRKKEWGVNLFQFNDDSFTIRKDIVEKFCDLLIKENLRIKWKCDTRVNLIDYELLKKMKKSGCIHINLGVECGNQRMLDYIKKGITVEQILNAFKIARRVGISTQAYFMMGFPEETESDIKDTISLMRKIKPNHPCWSIATPYPGTELFDICKKEGLLPKEIDWSKFHHHSKSMGFSKYISRERLNKIANKIERITFWIKVRHYLFHPIRLLKELKIV